MTDHKDVHEDLRDARAEIERLKAELVIATHYLQVAVTYPDATDKWLEDARYCVAKLKEAT